MKAMFAIMFAAILGGVLFIASAVAQQTPAAGQPAQGRVPPGQPMAGIPDGQNVPNHPHPPMPDPLADVMFPPDMILGNARQLGLTDQQKAFIRGEVQKTTSAFNDLQWKLQDEMELFHEILKANPVNEEQALAELNKVLDIEREIKRLHVGLAIRMKNHLTPEQQAQLHQMRSADMRPMLAPGAETPRP